MKPRNIGALTALVLIALTMPAELDAQSLGDRIRDRARQQAEERAERRAAEAVDKALDGAEVGIRCVFTDTQCITRAEEDGEVVIYVDPAGNRTDAYGNPSDETNGHGATLRLDDPAWANFDFVAGDRVLFFDDYSADRVGNFPRGLVFGQGNAEVAVWQDRRFVRITSRGFFRVPLPETLPDRFSLEFEVHQAHASHSLRVVTGAVAPPHMLGVYAGSVIRVDRSGTGIESHQGSGGEALTAASRTMEAVPTVRVMGDGGYVKVYVDEERVANVPNAELERTRELTFIIGWADPDAPVYVGPIHVAAGGASIYDALMEDGRVVTRGILFDVGAADIQPESRQTLIEIGEMLAQHPDLRLRIEGHTDSVGDAAANQALSERRADAVRRYLLNAHRIDGVRLEAHGFGQTQPIDTNDTSEGRRNNRRVELVRL
jgi:OmpA-OmpF porin, OOP family